MPGPPDLYRVIGVAPKASDEEIRRAYRRHAIVRHRRGVLRLKDQLDEMEAAYRVLTNPEQRQRYDAERELYERPARAESAAEAATLRREGQLRRAYANKIARDSERIGREQHDEHGAFISELERALQASAPQSSRLRWLLVLLLFVVIVAALAIFVSSAR